MAVTAHEYVIGVNTSPPNFEAIPGSDTAAESRCSRTTWRPIVSSLPHNVRQLRRQVLAETLANGLPVSLAGVTVALTAHVTLCETPLVWSRDHIETLLWFGMQQTVRDLGVELPEDAAEALHAIVALCVDSEYQSADSDASAELFAPLRELTRL